ncbi:MAG: hypothetical protein IPN96_20335 [Anaerolineales bacterium]|nr:hypothetical protein [Anaerolineales bacterium]
MTEQSTQAPGEPKKNNMVLYAVIGIVILCCLCCALAFIGQYLLENSNFSLVHLFRLTV